MKASGKQVGGDHYRDFVIQPSEFIHRNGIGFLEGNVIKYVCRHARKHGAGDLRKARHYIDLLLEWQYGEADSPPPSGGPVVTDVDSDTSADRPLLRDLYPDRKERRR